MPIIHKKQKLDKKETPTVRLELTTPGLEVRCAIQLRHDGLSLLVLHIMSPISSSRNSMAPVATALHDHTMMFEWDIGPHLSFLLHVARAILD